MFIVIIIIIIIILHVVTVNCNCCIVTSSEAQESSAETCENLPAVVRSGDLAKSISLASRSLHVIPR